MAAKVVSGHKFIFEFPLGGSLKEAKCSCECGNWSMCIPDVGAYGHTTSRARMAQVLMGHGKHTKPIHRNKRSTEALKEPK